jgi:hypothetical protein
MSKKPSVVPPMKEVVRGLNMDSSVWQDFCSAFSLRVSRLPTIARAAIDGAPLVDRHEVMRALAEEMAKIFSRTPVDKCDNIR